VSESRRAIIVGSAGQDGRLLTDFLRTKHYALTLVTRTSCDITDVEQVNALVKSTNPNEIYFLAAHHHSSEAVPELQDELQAKSFAVNTIAWEYFLKAAAAYRKDCRLFYASSCLVFAANDYALLDEQSQMAQGEIYSRSKQASMQLCREYRETLALHASCGILFNHESVYRAPNYLSKKIARAAANATPLILGSLDALADWGNAADYVHAMHAMLQMPTPDDYVIATGVSHSVREFAEIAFTHVGLDYRNYVREDRSLLTRPPERRIGNATKLHTATGWEPSVSFEQMIRQLVQFERAAA
jgi:GDPmannose 4,6-dehydratase